MVATTGPQTVQDFSLSNSTNKEKTIQCGKIVNSCVEDLVSKIKEGANASIYDLCVASDEKIVTLLAPHYVKQKAPKGVAFPTCISPNKTICHYSPANKEKSLKIQPGDVIKIEMGAHLDNFATYVAHTVVVPQTLGSENGLCIPPEHEKPFLAMHYIKELVCHALVPENKPDALIKQAIAVAESLNCTLAQNIKCMRLSRSLEDVDDKYFSLNPTAEMRKDSNTLVFKTDELYLVDIILSKEALDKEFHKKPLNLMPNIEEETTCYQLLEYFQPHKVKMANTVHNIISKKHGNNVFNIRGILSDSKEQFGFDQLKQGIEEFPVSVSSNGEISYQCKFTILIKKNKPQIIAGKPLDIKNILEKTDYKLPETVAEFLKTKQNPK